MKAEAEDALPKDKKKRQQEYEVRSKMAKCVGCWVLGVCHGPRRGFACGLVGAAR